MRQIRIPIPAIRWLTIQWGDTEPAPRVEPQPAIEPTSAPTPAPRGPARGINSHWLQTTGRHRKAWERYYQIKREQMDYLILRCGHLAPFSQQEIVEHSHVFARYLDQRTDPVTQGLGRPRLRSV